MPPVAWMKSGDKAEPRSRTASSYPITALQRYPQGAHRYSVPVRDPRPLDQASDSPVGAATRRFTERCSRLETRKPITASTLIRVKT